MKRWLPFVLPFVVVLAAGVGFRIWTLMGAAPACGAYAPIELDALDYDSGCVRVTGQAHFEVVVRQTLPGNLLRDEETLYLFPLFEPGQVDERAVRILVRTERAPEDLVSFETVTIEGRASLVTAEQVPFGTEIEIGKRSNYFFSEPMVLLVPDSVSSDGETWRPRTRTSR